mmetsp:Transcript_17578/g.38154  ORF Transcript_17578/g.38154 Transcript_17578/m.38154 type:complete len:108 (-) Transcript_17578:547-870(-)
MHDRSQPANQSVEKYQAQQHVAGVALDDGIVKRYVRATLLLERKESATDEGDHACGVSPGLIDALTCSAWWSIVLHHCSSSVFDLARELRRQHDADDGESCVFCAVS